MKRHEVGLCRVWTKGDAASFPIHPACHDMLVAKWMGGLAFAEVYDLAGSRLTLKLGEVVAVGLATPSQVAAAEAEDALEQLLGDAE